MEAAQTELVDVAETAGSRGCIASSCPRWAEDTVRLGAARRGVTA